MHICNGAIEHANNMSKEIQVLFLHMVFKFELLFLHIFLYIICLKLIIKSICLIQDNNINPSSQKNAKEHASVKLVEIYSDKKNNQVNGVDVLSSTLKKEPSGLKSHEIPTLDSHKKPHGCAFSIESPMENSSSSDKKTSHAENSLLKNTQTLVCILIIPISDFLHMQSIPYLIIYYQYRVCPFVHFFNNYDGLNKLCVDCKLNGIECSSKVYST